MAEICIPLPDLGSSDMADINVTVKGSEDSTQYRIEVFSMGAMGASSVNKDELLIKSLREKIVRILEHQ